MQIEIKPYIHETQYYETDAMRIVHHSNYIRWMEEARMDYLKQIDLPYEQLEERGIMFPVLSAYCEYKMAVTYGAKVKIKLEIEWFDGIRYGVSYRLMSEDESILHATGATTHSFLNRDLKPIRLKRSFPDIYENFLIYSKELRGVAKKKG